MNNQEFILHLTHQTIVLMGISFMVGSLFTVFVLLILDMMRAARAGQGGMQEHVPMDDDMEIDRDAA